MQAKLLALLLIFNIKWWSWSASAQEVTSIASILGPVVKIPSETISLSPRVILSCALTIAPGVNYTTQWKGPRDTGTIDPVTNTDRYVITNGRVRLPDGSESPGTTLAIRRLSYQDAGVYTCSGRSLAPSNEEIPSSPMVSATIDLQLDVELSSKFNETMVMSTTSDSTVELSCEMSAFIRPDSSLIWEGPTNQILTSDLKYQITFSNGSRNTAVDGSGVLVPSRLSTLVISNPGKSDQGVYTCSIMGTNQTIDLVIMVKDAQTIPPTTAESVDDSTETNASTETDATTAAMDGVTDPRRGSMGTTQKVGSGSKSSHNYMVNTVVVSVIVTAGALVQLYV